MIVVQWERAALEELSDLWGKADPTRRQPIVAATHDIDWQLRKNPEDQGEPRDGGRRVLLKPPLGLIFRIASPNAPERTVVQVLHVWRS